MGACFAFRLCDNYWDCHKNVLLVTQQKTQQVDWRWD